MLHERVYIVHHRTKFHTEFIQQNIYGRYPLLGNPKSVHYALE